MKQKTKSKSEIFEGYERDRDVAAALGIGVAGLRGLRKKGLPSIRVGKAVLIPIAEARAWLARNGSAER